MDWDHVLQKAIEALVGLAVPVLAIFLCKLIMKVIGYFKAKTDDLKAKAFLDEIQHAVEAAVAYVSQTIVDDLKKAGKFDETAAKAAFSTAFNTVMATISSGALQYLQSVVESPGDFITAKIEECVYDSKFEVVETTDTDDGQTNIMWT